MSLLKGKNILIVGVANKHSIASGIAASMAKHGANLAFTYQNDRFKQKVENLAEEWGSKACFPCDVTKDEEIDQVFKELGKDWDGLDCIVHAVGFAPSNELDGNFVDVTTREGFKIAHDISAYSFVALAKAGKDLMKERNGSLITLSYLGSQKTITQIRINTRSGAVTASWEIQGSNDDSSFTDTGYDLNAGGSNGWKSLTGMSSNNTWRYWKFYKTNGAAGGGYHAELAMEGTPTNATGSIISNTYTAPSSRSSVSGVLLYRDVSGTATLGTDLKVFFSCNNGTNYTEATSYTALNMAFKTGVKAVTLGKATCTAGTQIKFKVEWANQASGSKVTGCQGVALQY